MVENAKKMMGVTVCSSEKKDSHNRYSRFSLNVMPYPGVEFFKEFSSADPQKAASMYFDWSRTVDPAVVSIGYPRMPLKWDDYKRWDLVTLTQNYLKLMLTMLSDTSCSGLLVHCVSSSSVAFSPSSNQTNFHKTLTLHLPLSFITTRFRDGIARR